MSIFISALQGVNPAPGNRRWAYVPYDQLGAVDASMADENPRNIGFIMIENAWKPAQRPYHKQKLAIILANMRHFALEQAKRGVCIKYIFGKDRYSSLLAPLIGELGIVSVCEPAERELREDLRPLVDGGALRMKPHSGWLTSSELFRKTLKPDGKPRMDSFYRASRKATDILMFQGKPVGGKYSFDSENRRPWKGTPPAPSKPLFPSSDIKNEVGGIIESSFGHHPGKLDLNSLPCTIDDANSLWSWAINNCMENFGPYEDAMSTESSGLFHTRISALLNINRLAPQRLVRDVWELDIDLPSKEGFIRQVLGWREYVRHCHEYTNGFRDDRFGPKVVASDAESCGRYSLKSEGSKWNCEAGASPNFMDSFEELPPVYWGEKSGFNCLDSVINDVWNEAYSHHITRLMILCNFGALLDVCPRQLTDWFWVAYQDAYDWVVEPNVFGMGLYALGDFMTTKPYVAGSAYINRMSDYCGSCAFNPSNDCPVTNLYWAYLDRHSERLKKNVRLSVVMSSLSKRDKSRKEMDRAVFRLVSKTLARGEALSPTAIVDLKHKRNF